MPELREIIAQEIKKRGPVTFARFMEMALYYPEHGYYTRPEITTGPAGDFYTGPDVHPAFGQSLARLFTKMWEILGRPERWALVEYGPGTGRLARQILSFLQDHCSRAIKGLTYWNVEISPGFLTLQKQELSSLCQLAGKICWVRDASELPEKITGCIFSNELVDSFPVHRVRQSETGLQEIYVNYRKDFFEEEGPLSTPLLDVYFSDEKIILEPGQAAEVNLAARNWLQKVAEILKKGFLLTIDYGGTASEIYSPLRPEGTLRCFFQHRLVSSPYENIGRQDITASVNFSSLIRWGEEFGLTSLGLFSQAKFLLEIGILDLLKTPVKDYCFDEKRTRDILAIKKLLHPEVMGDAFRVLLQSKGLPAITTRSLFRKNTAF
ncbi:MAG: class I SAM-dependent methyltransferase [Desulfotomaculales bacterium]